MQLAAIDAWPMAVVSRCGRMMSPATKCPGRSVTRKNASASIRPRPLSSCSSPTRLPPWPMAETSRSASISNSVPSRATGRPSTMSHSARRSARARPSVGQQHLGRHHPGQHRHAFSQRILHLVLGRGHARARQERGQGHRCPGTRRRHRDVVGDESVHHHLGSVLGVDAVDAPEPAGDGDDVDGGVPAADAHHPIGRDLEPAGVERLQELHPAHAVRRVAARHRQRAPALASDRPQDRIVHRLDLLEAHVATDARRESRLDAAEGEDAVDLAVEEPPRRAVAGNAVAHHAAERLVVVVDRAPVAAPAELVRGGESGRPAADDRDMLAGVGRGRLERVAFRDGSVADELLHGVDPDEVLHLVAVAAVLARRRAHPAHLRRERVGVGRATERVLLPAHAVRRLLQPPHHLEPAPDVLPGGAASLARRGAVHVGRALVGVVGVEDSGLEIRPVVVAVAELAEGVAFVAVGLAPGGRHARSLVGLSVSARRGMPASVVAAEHDRVAHELVHAEYLVHFEAVVREHLRELALADGADGGDVGHPVALHHLLERLHPRQRALDPQLRRGRR